MEKPTSNKFDDDELDTLTVLDYAAKVFEDAEIAREWIHCEAPALSGSRPVELLGTFRGRQLVCEALGKIECGEFS
ncbi:MAG: MbcA/ParS/Xre antitoxin family protein [Halomonas sp.]|uniref:MbcA/ParS/Xre antitoxin family protein n=1 Tax=unclassified Halomonas TaxID=2609666 RepID=UPI0032DE2F36